MNAFRDTTSVLSRPARTSTRSPPIRVQPGRPAVPHGRRGDRLVGRRAGGQGDHGADQHS
jgi:hypothetical protein